jgi:small acid-soluble spore protein H (minor)
MKMKRASEIVSSPVMADVTYYDIPVYIESVSAENKTALIHPLSQPGSIQRVSVSNLVEHS